MDQLIFEEVAGPAMLGSLMNAFVKRFGLPELHLDRIDEAGSVWINNVHANEFKRAVYVRGLMPEHSWELYQTTFRGTQFAEVERWKSVLSDLKSIWATRPKSLRKRKVKHGKQGGEKSADNGNGHSADSEGGGQLQPEDAGCLEGDHEKRDV